MLLKRSLIFLVWLFFLSISPANSLQENEVYKKLLEEALNPNLSSISGYFDNYIKKSAFTNLNEKEEFSKQLLQFAEASNNASYKIAALMFRWHLYGDFQTRKAIQQLDSAEELAGKINDTRLLGEIYYQRGTSFYEIGKLEDALTNYQIALDHFKSDYPQKVAIMQNVIAGVYYNNLNYAEALTYGRLALSYFETIPQERIYAEVEFISCINTIGLAYEKTNELDSAIYYFDRSYSLAVKYNHAIWQSLVLGNLAIVYLKQGDGSSAIPLLEDDLKNNKNQGYEVLMPGTYSALANAYLLLDKTDTTKLYLDSAWIALQQCNCRDDLDKYYQVYSEYSQQLGEFENAITFQKLANQVQDSISKRNVGAQLSKIASRYEFDRQQARIEILEKENELQNSKIKFWDFIAVGVVIILVLISLLVIVLIRNLNRKKLANKMLLEGKNKIDEQNDLLKKQSELLREKNDFIAEVNQHLKKEVDKQNQELIEVNSQLESFLYRASHDFRQPLCTILGLENIAKMQTDDPEVIDVLGRITTTTNKMDRMLKKLQHAHYLTIQRYDKPNKEIDLVKLVYDSLHNYEEIIKTKEIELSMDIVSTEIKSLPELFTIVIDNLLENAIIFGKKEKGRVFILGRQNNDSFDIRIEDDGIGIPERYQSQIFDPFFRGSQESQGSGLGLFLVKKAIKLMRGNIAFKSQQDKGTAFSISIPIT